MSLPSPTDGGTTYTFQLRRGIRFSNGELVRPEDFRRALERDLILGGNTNYGGPFADVVGGAACAAHPSHCDLSRGVVTDDAANTVTFHLVAPNPEFLERLTLLDAFAVPADIRRSRHRPSPAADHRPLRVGRRLPRCGSRSSATPTFTSGRTRPAPTATPTGSSFKHIDSGEAGLTAVERGTADYMYRRGAP